MQNNPQLRSYSFIRNIYAVCVLSKMSVNNWTYRAHLLFPQDLLCVISTILFFDFFNSKQLHILLNKVIMNQKLFFSNDLWWINNFNILNFFWTDHFVIDFNPHSG